MNETERRRLARIESRLVQLMFHLGMDPYAKFYDSPSSVNDKNTRPDTQGFSQTEDRPKSVLKKIGRLCRIGPSS